MNVKKITIAILSILLLVSCKLTEQKAKRQLVNIEAKYSYLFANTCSRLYTIKERIEIETAYIKGDTKTIIDTQYVDCEKDENKGKQVAVHCKSTHTTDTFKKVEKSVQENTAKLDVCMQNLDAEKQKCKDLEIAYEKKIATIEADKNKFQNELEKYKKIERTIKWILGIASILILLIFALKNGWFGKIWKLIKNIF